MWKPISILEKIFRFDIFRFRYCRFFQYRPCLLGTGLSTLIIQKVQPNLWSISGKAPREYSWPYLSGLYYKSFTIVIYARNDCTIVEPVLWNYDYNCNLRYKPNLALARIVNYDHMLCYKLKRNLWQKLPPPIPDPTPKNGFICPSNFSRPGPESASDCMIIDK